MQRPVYDLGCKKNAGREDSDHSIYGLQSNMPLLYNQITIFLPIFIYFSALYIFMQAGKTQIIQSMVFNQIHLCYTVKSKYFYLFSFTFQLFISQTTDISK